MGFDWEEERRIIFEERGLKLGELEKKRREKKECTDLESEGGEIDRRERWRRIIDSKYNK